MPGTVLLTSDVFPHLLVQEPWAVGTNIISYAQGETEAQKVTKPAQDYTAWVQDSNPGFPDSRTLMLCVLPGLRVWFALF